MFVVKDGEGGYNMIICGIDPGTETSGVCVWDTVKQGVICSDSVADNRYIGVSGVVGFVRYIADRYVIEDITCYGMPVGKEVFETCKLIGRLQERLDNPIVIAKRDVQLHFCNTTKAKDANIKRVLKDRFGEKGTRKNPGITYGLKDHAWDSFALCIWYEDTQLSNKDVREAT